VVVVSIKMGSQIPDSWLSHNLAHSNRCIFSLPGKATESICADLSGILKEILSYGIGGLYTRHDREDNVFLLEPFLVDSLNRAVSEENQSIKTDLEMFLCHFICNVN
jgi:hypothetical protein